MDHTNRLKKLVQKVAGIYDRLEYVLSLFLNLSLNMF